MTGGNFLFRSCEVKIESGNELLRALNALFACMNEVRRTEKQCMPASV